MSTRKIRMTQAGLVAMLSTYDEALVTTDDMAHDRHLCTAWAELQDAAARAPVARNEHVDGLATHAQRWDADEDAARAEAAWNAALTAALDNNLPALRAALTRASHAARAAGLPTDHEDAALAMLPGDAS